MNWLNKLERKFRGKAIKGLTNYLVGLTAIVFVLNYISVDSTFIDKFRMDPHLVLKGEVWRLISFIFIPPEVSPILIIFALYFLYLAGNGLEQEWGSFKFNFYYLTGIVGAIIASFILGGEVTTYYLNLSLFFAFAYIYPDYEILAFFIIPAKVKYLAIILWVFFAIGLFTASNSLRLAIIFSVVNFFIYFTPDMINNIKNHRSVFSSKKSFKSQIPKTFTYHKCTICGKTEKDDPNLEFRYCSRCEGDHEYCMEHLATHNHMLKEKD